MRTERANSISSITCAALIKQERLLPNYFNVAFILFREQPDLYQYNTVIQVKPTSS